MYVKKNISLKCFSIKNKTNSIFVVSHVIIWYKNLNRV